MYYHNMQNNITDCGIAVLKTILQQYDRKLPRNFVEEISVGEGQGLSLRDLEIILKKQGVCASSYEVKNLQELKNELLPAIAIIDQDGKNHYVVVHSFNNKSGEIILSDPAKIELTHPKLEEFEHIFCGYMLCIEHVEEMDKKNVENSLYDDIINTITFWKKIKYSLLSIAKWGMPVALLFIIQYLFMYQIENMNAINISLTVILFVFLSVGYYYMCLIYQHYKTELEKKVATKMTMQYLISEIKNVNTKKNSNDTEGVFWNIVISVLGILQKFYLKIDILLIVTCIGVIALLNWLYALIMLGFITGICIYSYTFKNLIKNRQVELIGASSEMSGCIQEMTQSTLDLKIFSDMKVVETYCHYTYAKYEKVRENIGKEDMKMMAFYDMCSYLAMALGLALLFVSYMKDTAFSATSMTFAFYMTIFMTMTFKSTFQRWIEYQKSINAIEYIEFMVNSSIEEEQETQVLGFEQVKDIEMEQVEVRLDDHIILNNLNFKSEQGKIIGISGENGSGKSTLAKTILGLIRPTKGIIRVNGTEYSNGLMNSDITKHISFYSSELYIYSDSVKNNINLNMFQDKKLNQNYSYLNELELEYLIFLNGINISQGERQKILLDRCFEKEKSIYIFDEPGINLDQESLKKMLKMFDVLRNRKKIVLVISHDEEILAHCDRHYYMAEGRLEKGRKVKQ